MSSLDRLRVGPRLILGFGIVLVFMLVILVIGLSRMAVMQSNLERIVREDYAQITQLNKMRDAVRFRGIALRDMILQDEFGFKRGESKRIREARTAYQEADQALSKLVVEADGQAMLTAIRDAEAASAELITQVIDAALSEDNETARTLIRDQVRGQQQQLIAQLDAMLDKLQARSLDMAQQAEQSYASARLLMLA